MRKLIVERSEHPGHAPIRVGTIASRLHAGKQQYDPSCERCGRTLQAQASSENAESLLRQHRLKCRPRVTVHRLEPIAAPRGIPHTATESSEHIGHPPIRIGRIYHDGPNREDATWTPVCERCSHRLEPGPSQADAASTLRKHRTTCRPGGQGVKGQSRGRQQEAYDATETAASARPQADSGRRACFRLAGGPCPAGLWRGRFPAALQTGHWRGRSSREQASAGRAGRRDR